METSGQNTGSASGKKRGKTFWIAIIAGLLAAAAVIFTVIAVLHALKSNQPTETSTEPASTTQSGVSEKEWKRAFAAYFKRIRESGELSEYADAYVVDLDGDTVPEVLGGWYSWVPMIAYYDDGSIKEVSLPEELVGHSTAYAGEYPNTLYFDAQQHVVIFRCESRTYGTMFYKTAVAYKYSKGSLTEYKHVELDLTPDAFEGVADEEVFAALRKRFDEQFAEFTKDLVLTAFEDVVVHIDNLLRYLAECFGTVDETASAPEEGTATTQTGTTAQAVVLNDDNVFELLKPLFDLYAESGIFYVSGEYDFSDTVPCKRAHGGYELEYDRGSRQMPVHSEAEYDSLFTRIPDGVDVRVKGFNSRKDVEKCFRDSFTDEILEWRLEMLDEAFEFGVLHEENGKLYYCPEWMLARGTYEIRLTGMKVTKNSDAEYTITTYTPKDYNAPQYCLETDQFLVRYVDGKFKLAGEYAGQGSAQSTWISESTYNQMMDQDYFIVT